MDKLPIKAVWTTKIIRADGSVECSEAENLVVDTGLDWLATYLTTSPGSAMAHIAVGTGTDAATPTDTALGGEVARNAMATSAASENVWITVATFAGDTDSVTSVALTEAGVFNEDTGGTMFQRLVSALGTLGGSDYLHLTVETTLGSRSA